MGTAFATGAEDACFGAAAESSNSTASSAPAASSLTPTSASSASAFAIRASVGSSSVTYDFPPSLLSATATSHVARAASTCILRKNCAHASCSLAAAISASTVFTATPAIAASDAIRVLRFTTGSSMAFSRSSRACVAVARFAIASSMRAWFSTDCATAGAAGGGEVALGSSLRSGSNVSTNADLTTCLSSPSSDATGADVDLALGELKLQFSGLGRSPPQVLYAITASHTHVTATQSTAAWEGGLKGGETGSGMTAHGIRTTWDKDGLRGGGWERSPRKRARGCGDRRPPPPSRRRTCVITPFLCSRFFLISAM